MKILIIGGTGLISTPLTRLLLERGEMVTLYNRGGTESRLSGSIKTLHGDRQSYGEFERAMLGSEKFDCVIDMVGFDPLDAESAVRAFAGRTNHFIFCSTVDVYKKPATRLPYREQEPYGGLNTYGKNKVSCEKTLLAAHSRGDFQLTIIRPAYTYGEGRALLYPVGSAAHYMDRLRAGRPILVPGDGNSLWVACHADDVARAFANAVGNATAYGRAYHTTGEDWMTWNQYHEGAAYALGAPPPDLVHIPTAALMTVAPARAASVADNFQFNNIFDNSAARADLGFEPRIAWVEGVRRVAAWIETHPQTASRDDATIDDKIIDAWRDAQTAFSSQCKV